MKQYIIFFFQAEDGIRDGHVTGVQTCALPISARRSCPASATSPPPCWWRDPTAAATPWWWRSCCSAPSASRSEERRVGKECGYRRWKVKRDEKRKRREKHQEQMERKTGQTRKE